MKCPRCKEQAMNQATHRSSKVVLDVCPTCKGIWFDAGELDRVLDVAIKDLHPPKHDERSATALCPKCYRPMTAFDYPQTLAKVDMCRDCSGVWLDRGEFEEIRTVRTQLRRQSSMEEYAPIHGVKGALIGWINSCLTGLWGTLQNRDY